MSHCQIMFIMMYPDFWVTKYNNCILRLYTHTHTHTYPVDKVLVDSLFVQLDACFPPTCLLPSVSAFKQPLYLPVIQSFMRIVSV